MSVNFVDFNIIGMKDNINLKIYNFLFIIFWNKYQHIVLKIIIRRYSSFYYYSNKWIHNKIQWWICMIHNFFSALFYYPIIPQKFVVKI